VTGDTHLLKLREFQGVKILRPAEFLEECQSRGR
jgi:predicted nucleic acid-binding protein